MMLIAGALCADGATAQQREGRLALIIANEAYVAENLGRLPGTQRDAEVMRDALERAGFEVTVHTNLERIPMRDAIRNFARQLGRLGQEGVGFLYYSGHGIADDPNGTNYLIPVDAEIDALTDLPIMGLSLTEYLQMIELAHARATVVVIDACRNTPVSFGRAVRGLAPVAASTDTLIAFSTQPGEVAADDGLYARLLAQEFVKPGANAAGVFQAVQSAVADQTGRRQRPRYDNGILQPLVFVPGPGSVDRLPSGHYRVDFSAGELGTGLSRMVAAEPYLRRGEVRVTVSSREPAQSQIVFQNNLGAYGGRALAPTASQNFLTQAETGNVAAAYTLNFSRRLESVSFLIPALYPAAVSGVTFPAWRATALGPRGETLDVESDSLRASFDDAAAQRHILRAPAGSEGIVAVRFESDPRSNGTPFAAFSAVMIEELIVEVRREQ